MGRNSYRNIEEALALQARLKKREAFQQAGAEAAAVAAGKKPGSKASKPVKHAAAGAGEVRIIGGQWRRTRLNVAQRPGLRPTPDRVRETLFNWLGQDLTGWRCLDAFAGTGALGLEAASRGATQVRLVENDAGLAQQLERLAQQLKAEGVHVQRGDGVAALTQSAPGHWHAIFIDPPFGVEALFAPAIKAAAQAVAHDGFIYLEAPKAWTQEELAAYGLQPYRYLKAGAVHAHLLQKIAD